MNKPRQIIIHDTTLRDGEQAPGNSMTIEQKIEIACVLDAMGIDIIEAGFPAASPHDFQAIQEISAVVTQAKVSTFCRSKKEDIDQGIEASKTAKYPEIEMVVTTSNLHLEARKLTPKSNLNQIRNAIIYAKSEIRDVKVILEDATRANEDYLKTVIDVGLEAGANSMILADTVGCAIPCEIEHLVRSLKSTFPQVPLGIHCHNDLGLALANTLAAIEAGVEEVQGTLCGLGERSGNLAIEEVLAVLKVKSAYYDCTNKVDLTHLYPACQKLLALVNHPPLRTKAIIGENSFATEAGMHQSAILKNPETYEFLKPETFGRSRCLVLGRHSGRGLIRHRLAALGRKPEPELVENIYSELVLSAFTEDSFNLLNER